MVVGRNVHIKLLFSCEHASKMVNHDSAHPLGGDHPNGEILTPLLGAGSVHAASFTLHPPRRQPLSFSHGDRQSRYDKGYSYTHADESLPIVQSEKPLYFVTRKGTHQERERETEESELREIPQP